MKGENVDQKDKYVSDLQALAHSTRSQIQVEASSPSPFVQHIGGTARMTSSFVS